MAARRTSTLTPTGERYSSLIHESALRLAGAISRERLYSESAHALRRMVPFDACVVAIARGDDGEALPRRQYAEGDDRIVSALVGVIESTWERMQRRADFILRDSDDGFLLLVPISGTKHVRGVVACAVGEMDGGASALKELKEVLTALGEQVGICHDRIELEERAERGRRVEAVSQTVSAIVGALRAPLLGISSAAQLLRFRSGEDPVLEKNAGRILREADRLNRLVNAMSEIERAGFAELRHGDPDAAWDHVLQEQLGQMESRGLSLTRTRSHPRAECAMDQDLLSHAFAHLLENAITAAPEKSEIFLSSQLLPDGSWCCRLRNGGSPLSSDIATRAFDVFFSTRAGATGIGLAACQRIIEAHRGSISLDSSVEDGTTLTVILPPAA